MGFLNVRWQRPDRGENARSRPIDFVNNCGKLHRSIDYLVAKCAGSLREATADEGDSVFREEIVKNCEKLELVRIVLF